MNARKWARVDYFFSGLNLGFAGANVQYKDITLMTFLSAALGIGMFFLGLWQDKQARIQGV